MDLESKLLQEIQFCRDVDHSIREIESRLFHTGNVFVCNEHKVLSLYEVKTISVYINKVVMNLGLYDHSGDYDYFFSVDEFMEHPSIYRGELGHTEVGAVIIDALLDNEYEEYALAMPNVVVVRSMFIGNESDEE